MVQVTTFFIGLAPPAGVARRLADAMSTLGDPWPVPHVTLKAPPGLLADLSWLPGVRDAAARTAPFRVSFGEIGTFDGRVLRVLVHGEGLAPLRACILRAVEVTSGALVGQDEERPFVPHLTLAVARRRRDLAPYDEVAAALDGLEPFEVQDVCVFRRDGPGTPYLVHERLALDLTSCAG
jgi:2'-5' RNA ligase